MSTAIDRDRKRRLFEMDEFARQNGGIVDPDWEQEYDMLLSEDATDAIDVMKAYDAAYERLDAQIKEARQYRDWLEERRDFYKSKASDTLVAQDYLLCQRCNKEKGLDCACKKPESKRLERTSPGSWTHAILVQSKGRIEPLVPASEMPSQFQREVKKYEPDTDMIRLALELNPDSPPCTDDGRPIARLVKEASVRVTENKQWLTEQSLKQAMRLGVEE